MNELENELLDKSSMFEELVHTRGWELIKAYYANKVQDLATKMLTGEDIEIEKFESERQQLIGIKKLMTEVTSTLDSGKRIKEQRKTEGSTTE